MNLNAITFFIAFSLIFTNRLLAQDFQGRAYYESKTTVDMSDFEGREMSEEQKQRIAGHMKRMFEKNYLLTFNRSESLYKEEDHIEAQSARSGRFRGMMHGINGGPQYKNIKDLALLKNVDLFGKQFLIKDTLPKFEWKMENESKQIGEYLCFKATTVKEAEVSNTSRFRGARGNDSPKAGEKETDEETEIKQVIVTAWFTPQIPVNQGPDDYWGLPGLILEINADKTTILCSKIVLNPEVKEEIMAPSKGKKVTRAEFENISKKKIEELQNMNQGRDGGGRSRR
ncbi:GLPGLI family protein [Mariniflexile ostreae]|uniref:GLPGLI family protein n=1 Tax=Mariniflexile ostreae TaxID=1520892 RepID=A0ABV5FC22_9FLAO